QPRHGVGRRSRAELVPQRKRNQHRGLALPPAYLLRTHPEGRRGRDGRHLSGEPGDAGLSRDQSGERLRFLHHHRDWRGYFAAAPTPFDRDGALDSGRLRDVLAWFVDQRAHGVVVNGTTGEWVAQSVAERQTVLEIARSAVGSK